MPETTDRFRWHQANRRFAAWLRTASARRGMVVVGIFTACFFWTTAVAGLSIAMAESGVEHWWLVLVFGLLMLVIALAGTYGVLAYFGRGSAGPSPTERGDTGFSVSSPRRTVRAGPPIEPLSPREREVLEQLATGRSNTEIARELYLAPGTVKAHLNRIFRKLEATSRLQAVTHARDAGLLEACEPK